MVNNILKSATEGLRIFNLFSLEELVDKSQAADQEFITQQSEVANDNPLLAKLQEILVETQQGALPSDRLIDQILQIKKDFLATGLDDPLITTVVPFFDNRAGLPDPVDGVIANIIGLDSDVNESNQSTKDAPTVSVYQILSSRISPSIKNADAVAIFMNALPTIELSRAVPLLDVTFQLPRPPIVNDQISGLSLVKFLEGAKSTKEFGAADLSMIRAKSVNQDLTAIAGGEIKTNEASESGIELFISPQTLVNAEPDNSEQSRIVPIIDRFRPFASLTSFQVDVTPAPGIMSYRTAKLKFTLHDRSRLHELADFIKPDMYSKSEILIEYGWVHPDGPERDNPFGAFINALRVKEKYYVKNNTFMFKENGEVVIELELYTKGAMDFYTSNVGDGKDVGDTQKLIQKLQERIGELRDRLFSKQQGKRFTKEIRGAQVLNAASDGNSELQLTKALRRELDRSLNSFDKKGAGEDANALRKLLIDLYGKKKDGRGGLAKKLENSIGSAIRLKIEKIRRGDKKTPDPFLFVADITKKEERKGLEETFVSFAKLMLIFVVEPLIATKKFDDVQLLFYRFNRGAGLIGGPRSSGNVGAFAIDIDNFHDRYKKLATSRRSANLTLRDFMQFINSAFVDDPSNRNYGMRRLYIEDQRKQGDKPKPRAKYRDANVMSREIEKIMRCEAHIPDGVFRMPHLDVYIECVPGGVDEQGTPADSGNNTTVLRIHVFDKVATAYTTQGSLLAAARNNEIGTIGDVPVVEDPNKPNQDELRLAENVLALAENRNLIRQIPGPDGKDKVYEVVGGPNNIKEFVSNTMPTIIYGANNTAVTSAGLKSMTDNRLSTINMIRAGDAGPLSPNGASQGGLPMQVLPAQLDLRSVGCPIVEYAQQFFVDMQSGTTADNIYTVTKIQHTIEPGKFHTSLGMTPLDSYGQYRSMIQKAGAAIKILGGMVDQPTALNPEQDTPDEDC